MRTFTNELASRLVDQGHPAPGRPTQDSDMIIGLLDIPRGESPLSQRMAEIPAKIMEASSRYGINAFKKNYTLVTTIAEDLTQLPKREMEYEVRSVMSRAGALKILFQTPDKIALATMEGGLGHEFRDNPQMVKNMRDRLVTFACARASGSYQVVENAINREELESSRMPDHIASAFRWMGEWGYLAKPFSVDMVASRERARLAERMMGWSRQSESAGAAQDPTVTAPEEYRMGQATGVVLTTKSGRFNIDKTKLTREDVIPVSVVERDDHAIRNGDPYALSGFRRYALGVIGETARQIVGPSIEYDEMAAALDRSPSIRVSHHPSGLGWKPDASGEIVLKRARAFFHGHFAVSEVEPTPIWGKNALEVVEYIPANVRDYPYPFGCGVDIAFACSSDAMLRSRGVQDVNSGIMLAYFDAMDHGTHVVILAEPIPGTDLIPYDPFSSTLLPLIHPETGPMRLSQEVPQV